MSDYILEICQYIKSEPEVVLAAISLIVSIFAIYIPYRQAKRSKLSELETIHFQKVYSEFLLEGLPVAKANTKFELGKYIGVDSYIDCIRKVRHCSLYYKYYDEVFYNKLINVLRGLEDILANSENRTYESIDDQQQLCEKIEQSVGIIYKTINKKYRKFK